MDDMKLSEHFYLSEFTTSQTATRKSIDNTPSVVIIDRLQATAIQLEAVRMLLGHPLSISSGYRSRALNAAIGGVPTSAHVEGWAADFVCPAFGTPLDICRALKAHGIKMDQVIEEGTWVHISFAPTMRGQYLTKDGAGYASGLKS